MLLTCPSALHSYLLHLLMHLYAFMFHMLSLELLESTIIHVICVSAIHELHTVLSLLKRQQVTNYCLS